jgi:TetR/AcrR family transcriptional repressor of nem operon
VPRPRGFDEDDVVKSAVTLFASRAYDGISVDDLVAQLGVHRNSLYKTFGSKRGLYLAALRWYLTHDIRPFLATVAVAPDPAEALRRAPPLDLLLLATVERAPEDREVAAEITLILNEFDQALAGDGPDATALAAALTATMLGLRLRSRAGAHQPTDAMAALARRLTDHP